MNHPVPPRSFGANRSLASDESSLDSSHAQVAPGSARGSRTPSKFTSLAMPSPIPEGRRSLKFLSPEPKARALEPLSNDGAPPDLAGSSSAPLLGSSAFRPMLPALDHAPSPDGSPADAVAGAPPADRQRPLPPLREPRKSATDEAKLAAAAAEARLDERGLSDAELKLAAKAYADALAEVERTEREAAEAVDALNAGDESEPEEPEPEPEDESDFVESDDEMHEAREVRKCVRESTDQTSTLSTSIRVIFGRVDRSRRILEGRRKNLRR